MTGPPPVVWVLWIEWAATTGPCRVQALLSKRAPVGHTSGLAARAHAPALSTHSPSRPRPVWLSEETAEGPAPSGRRWHLALARGCWAWRLALVPRLDPGN